MAQQWYGKDCNSAPSGFPFPILWRGCLCHMGEMACDWHSKLNFAVSVAVWTALFWGAISRSDLPCLRRLSCALLSGARVPLSTCSHDSRLGECLLSHISLQIVTCIDLLMLSGEKKKTWGTLQWQPDFYCLTVRAVLLSFGLCYSGMFLKHCFSNSFPLADIGGYS